MDDLSGEGDDGEVEADEGGGREGVGDAALEDEVHVHEAVADDSPGEGERQEDQREADEVGDGGGDDEVGEEGDDVEEGEGDDRDEGSAGEPLELLALEGGLVRGGSA